MAAQPICGNSSFSPLTLYLPSLLNLVLLFHTHRALLPIHILPRHIPSPFQWPAVRFFPVCSQNCYPRIAVRKGALEFAQLPAEQSGPWPLGFPVFFPLHPASVLPCVLRLWDDNILPSFLPGPRRNGRSSIQSFHGRSSHPLPVLHCSPLLSSWQSPYSLEILPFP